MHGDSCSATRVDPDRMCSTSLGDDCIGPSAPPCSGNNLLGDNALRRPICVSHSWRCAHQQPPVAYFPSAKRLELRGPLSTSHLFGSTRPRIRISRLRLHTSHTTAVSSRLVTFLLLPFAGGSSRQIQEKLGCLILAVQGRPRACPFLGSWRVLLSGKVHVRAEGGCSVFWRIDD